MQKFFNDLILRIIQDSSVSNTSHHPQFGEEGNRAIFVTVISVCFVEEIRRESRLCCKCSQAGFPWEVLAAPTSRIDICKEPMKRLKSTRKSFTQDASSYVTKELWAVL